MGYEYKVVDASSVTYGRFEPSYIQIDMDKYAKEGWRLVQTFTAKGNTVAYIFERPQ